MLQLKWLREPVEEPLAAAHDHGRDDDAQLVDDPGLEGLADDLRATHDLNVLVARRLPRALDRGLDSGNEAEPAALRLLLGPVGHDEERQPPGVLVAPVAGRLVRAPAADDRANPRGDRREPFGVLAGGIALQLVVVCPGSAEDPVVQPLAALAEPLPGTVVRPSDVPVNGRRDPGNYFRHVL